MKAEHTKPVQHDNGVLITPCELVKKLLGVIQVMSQTVHKMQHHVLSVLNIKFLLNWLKFSL